MIRLKHPIYHRHLLEDFIAIVRGEQRVKLDTTLAMATDAGYVLAAQLLCLSVEHSHEPGAPWGRGGSGGPRWY